MGSFDEEGPFNQGNSNSNNGDETAGAKKPVKVNFGLFELGIFIGLWVAMVVGYKLYSRYTQRNKKKNSWFGDNEEKLAYEKLLMTEPDNEELLKKALVRRAMTDVRRLMKVQEERDSIMALSRSGAISEEILTEFKAAEKELELELFDLQAEAETFKAGWSQEIVRDAVKLSRVEDELMAMKKRKEKEESGKKSSITDNKSEEDCDKGKGKVMDEGEKRRLLMELLREHEKEQQMEKQKAQSSSGGSLKKRSNSNGGKK